MYIFCHTGIIKLQIDIILNIKNYQSKPIFEKKYSKKIFIRSFLWQVKYSLHNGHNKYKSFDTVLVKIIFYQRNMYEKIYIFTFFNSL